MEIYSNKFENFVLAIDEVIDVRETDNAINDFLENEIEQLMDEYSITEEDNEGEIFDLVEQKAWKNFNKKFEINPDFFLVKVHLDPNAFYMNQPTGSVATGKQWMQDQIDIGFPARELESLIEVEKDEDGKWVDVE